MPIINPKYYAILKLVHHHGLWKVLVQAIYSKLVVPVQVFDTCVKFVWRTAYSLAHIRSSVSSVKFLMSKLACMMSAIRSRTDIAIFLVFTEESDLLSTG